MVKCCKIRSKSRSRRLAYVKLAWTGLDLKAVKDCFELWKARVENASVT